MNEMRPPRAKARKHDISAIASRYDRVALVLQGGGESASIRRSRTPAASPIGSRACPSAPSIPRSLPAMGRKNGYKISKLSGPLSPGARSGPIRRKATFFAIFAIRQAR
jgi:hypothetical protein